MVGRSSGNLIKGELAPELVKPTSNSPTTQRSLGNQGYLGIMQDVSYFFDVLTIVVFVRLARARPLLGKCDKRRYPHTSPSDREKLHGLIQEEQGSAALPERPNGISGETERAPASEEDH